MMRASFIFLIVIVATFAVISGLCEDKSLLEGKLTQKRSASAEEDLMDLLLENQYVNDQDQSPNRLAKRGTRQSWEEERQKKRYRPVMYDGYTLDINVDLFKSTVY
jgi:hypothetical protein